MSLLRFMYKINIYKFKVMYRQLQHHIYKFPKHLNIYFWFLNKLHVSVVPEQVTPAQGSAPHVPDEPIMNSQNFVNIYKFKVMYKQQMHHICILLQCLKYIKFIEFNKYLKCLNKQLQLHIYRFPKHLNIVKIIIFKFYTSISCARTSYSCARISSTSSRWTY